MKRRIHLSLLLGAAIVPAAAPVAAQAMTVGAAQQGACMNGDTRAVLAHLRSHHATVMRFGVSPARAGQGLSCVSSISRAGYKVYLTLQYDSRWSPSKTAAWFKRWLPVYAKVAPLWAVSIGNEQDVNPSETGQHYRATWNATEPVVKRITPHAKLVFAEAAPWSMRYVQTAWSGHRPAGVDAIGFHPYAGTHGNGLWTLPKISAWAASQHVPLWASEMTEWLDPPQYLKVALAHSPNVKMLVWYFMPARKVLPAWASLHPPAGRWY